MADTRSTVVWARAGTLVAISRSAKEASRRRSMFMGGRGSGSQGGGAKAGEDVAPVRLEEVAITRVVQSLVGGEGAAAQLAMIAEPRRRIVAVRAGLEPGARREGVGGPFPDAAA